MASSHVGGLSGAFIPVSEDAGMIHAATEGYLDITKLESMTAVCSVGLDMIVVPGDITPEVISAIIADEVRNWYGKYQNNCGKTYSGYRKKCRRRT